MVTVYQGFAASSMSFCISDEVNSPSVAVTVLFVLFMVIVHPAGAAKTELLPPLDGVSHFVPSTILYMAIGQHLNDAESPLFDGFFNDVFQEAGVVDRTPGHKCGPGGDGQFCDGEGMLDVSIAGGRGKTAIGCGR